MHPGLEVKGLKEYKDNIRIGTIWDSNGIAEAMDVETLIFR